MVFLNLEKVLNKNRGGNSRVIWYKNKRFKLKTIECREKIGSAILPYYLFIIYFLFNISHAFFIFLFFNFLSPKKLESYSPIRYFPSSSPTPYNKTHVVSRWHCVTMTLHTGGGSLSSSLWALWTCDAFDNVAKFIAFKVSNMFSCRSEGDKLVLFFASSFFLGVRQQWFCKSGRNFVKNRI